MFKYSLLMRIYGTAGCDPCCSWIRAVQVPVCACTAGNYAHRARMRTRAPSVCMERKPAGRCGSRSCTHGRAMSVYGWVDKTPASVLDSIPTATCSALSAAMCACGVITVLIVMNASRCESVFVQLPFARLTPGNSWVLPSTPGCSRRLPATPGVLLATPGVIPATPGDSQIGICE